MQLARNPVQNAPKRPFRPAPGRAYALASALMLLVAGSAIALEPEAAALAAVDQAERQTDDHLLESVADGFRAWLPGPTGESFNERRTYAGMVSEKKYFGEADGRKFVIGLHMLPNLGKWFTPTSLVLSHAKKNVLATQEGRELSFERKRMGEYPGGVLMYAPLDENAGFDVMQVHLVLVGQRLYILKASDPEEGDRSQVDRFFSSFEVIE